jgi:type III secretion system FlhB-like substrate exporter
MKGMTIEEGINQVYGGGAHVVILGAGASIASTIKNPEKSNKKLPSMDNLIDVVGLTDLVQRIPEELYDNNFETLYSNLYFNDSNSQIIKEIELRVNRYFKNMLLPDEPTIYDYLVLSLRNKDLIATFNWDPFLFQAWNRNAEFVENLPNLCFLHGNVAIGYSAEDKLRGPSGMQARIDGGVFRPTKLLYPVAQKNYTSDEFIKNEWERVKYYLGKDYITKRVTIFGYGAPDSDVEAIKLLNEAWGTSDDRSMEQFEIINVLPPDELRKKWSGFIHTHHYEITDNYFGSSLAYNPRRTFESYFSHNMPRTIKEAFRNSNPIPKDFKTMTELWEWHKPLIEAEERKEEENKLTEENNEG